MVLLYLRIIYCEFFRLLSRKIEKTPGDSHNSHSCYWICYSILFQNSVFGFVISHICTLLQQQFSTFLNLDKRKPTLLKVWYTSCFGLVPLISELANCNSEDGRSTDFLLVWLKYNKENHINLSLVWQMWPDLKESKPMVRMPSAYYSKTDSRSLL